MTKESNNTALWEIVYETDSTWDVTAGSGFYAAGIKQAALANDRLHGLTGDPAYFAQNLMAISNASGRDFLVQVPEPLTLSLPGFGGLLLSRCRK